MNYNVKINNINITANLQRLLKLQEEREAVTNHMTTEYYHKASKDVQELIKNRLQTIDKETEQLEVEIHQERTWIKSTIKEIDERVSKEDGGHYYCNTCDKDTNTKYGECTDCGNWK